MSLLLVFLLSQSTWDMTELSKTPATHDAPGFTSDGLQALFYDGPFYQGKPTRIFAWLGIPKAEGQVPAMVLVHGGGGTAFADWVKLWTSRGYAALAMDLCGAVPRKSEKGGWERHEHGGPPGWGGFDQIDAPERDQWTWQAVAAIAVGHSLLRSRREIDVQKVGVTGISWGGYLTCVTAAVDDRYRFAAPVYGCGFLGEDSTWLGTFAKMGPEKSARWLGLWDPSKYLERARKPMLWVNGTNDFAYPLGSYRKSYRLPPGERSLAIRVRMSHAHGGPGEKPEEIHAFANAFFKGGVPLARIAKQGLEGRLAWAEIEAKAPLVKAELSYTMDGGKWQGRVWASTPAALEGTRVSARVPEGATAAYLNVFDDRGLVTSAEHHEFEK